MVESIDRLGRVVCFYQIIDSNAHRFSPNVLYEDLADRFVKVQVHTIVGECRVEYLPTRRQAQKEGRGFDFFFEVNPLVGESR